MIYEFKALSTDVSPLDTTLTEATNVVPSLTGYNSLNGFRELTTTNLNNGSFTFSNFVFDNKTIYQLQDDFTLKTINTFSGNEDLEWQVIRFRGLTLANNINQGVLAYLTDSFKPVNDSEGNVIPLKAKYMTTNKDFLVLANINHSIDGERTTRVQWSGLGDEKDFVPSATTQSGYQELVDLGDIIGIHGEYIFLERGIYRMQYVGGSLIFKFSKISDIRLLSNTSIVEHNNIVYFVSTSGVYTITDSTLTNISDGFVTKDLKNNIENTKLGTITTGVYDNIVMWCLPFPNNSYKALCYKEGRFSFIEDLQAVGQIKQAEKSIDSFDQSIDTINYSFDDLEENPVRDCFIYNNKLSVLDPTKWLKATLTTGFIYQEGNSLLLNKVHPIIYQLDDTSLVTAIVKYSHTGIEHSFLNIPKRTINKWGDVAVRASGKYFQVTLEAIGSFSDFKGIDLTLIQQSNRR